MKIAIFSDIFLDVPGGICSSIRAQRDGLVKAGHEVVIFCPGRKGAETGVVTVPTHLVLRPNGAPLSKRPKAVERFVCSRYPKFGEDFDLVHVHHEGSCSLAGMRLARKFGLPLVQTMHGREDMAIEMNVPHPFKYFTAATLCFLHGRCVPHTVKVGRDAKLAGGLGNGSAGSLADGSAGGIGGALGLAPTRTRAKMWTLMVNHANFADFVVTPSEHFGRKLEHYGVSKPITVISNGIPDEMVARFDRGWTADGTPAAGVREMGEGETLRLFWNSRVSKEKRLLPILEALALVKRPFELAVYGNGNQLRKAKRVARRLGLMGKSRVTGGSAGNGEPVAVKKVEFFGRVEYETLLEKMRDEHLAVVGSFGFDTQSMALLEAEATGLPVLFIDPDMAEVVPAEGAVNVPLELNKKAARELWTAPTAEEIAGVIDGIKAEDIEKMSRAMYENRGEVLESRQLTKMLALYKEAVVGVD